ncbi:hypothetical protein BDF21DRAFT_227668 [Thamnidium elegans]|nr:hypothetical protein BDF21DRAFT_227668 [Thamnidium elegans]
MNTTKPIQVHEEEEDDDPYNERIERTGCFKENETLQLCFYDTKDWRQCTKEMKAFRDCFTRNKNNAGSQELSASSNSS